MTKLASPCFQCPDRKVGPKGKECGEHNCEKFKDYATKKLELNALITKEKLKNNRLATVQFNSVNNIRKRKRK